MNYTPKQLARRIRRTGEKIILEKKQHNEIQKILDMLKEFPITINWRITKGFNEEK